MATRDQAEESGRRATAPRVVLALALLVSWYAVALLLAAGLAAADAALLRRDALSGPSSRTPALFFLLSGLPVILAAGYGALTVSRDHTGRRDALHVTRGDAPALWRMVDDLAARTGVRPPSELFLTRDAEVSVVERSPLLGLLPGRRYGYLGMPLLIGLSRGELRALLCHELGHFATARSRLDRIAWRCSATLGRVRDRLDRPACVSDPGSCQTPLLHRLFAAYADVFDRLTLVPRRRQEAHADATAARVAGAGRTASALRSAYAVGAAWADFRHHLLRPSLAAGLAPDDPFGAFAIMLADPDYRDTLARHRRVLPELPESPRSSHPALTRRVAAIGALDPVPGGGCAAVTLGVTADHWAGLAVRVGATHVAGDAPCLLPTARWLMTTAELQAAASIRALRVHGEPDGCGPPSLGDVLRALDDGLAVAGTCDGRHDREVEAVTMLVGLHLVTGGRAAWLVGWTGRARLVCRETTEGELRDLVRAAVTEAAEVTRLRLHLADLGVDPGRRLPVGPVGCTGRADRPPTRTAWRRELRVGLRANWGLLALLLAMLGAVLATHAGGHGPVPPAYRVDRHVLPSPSSVRSGHPARAVSGDKADG